MIPITRAQLDGQDLTIYHDDEGSLHIVLPDGREIIVWMEPDETREVHHGTEATDARPQAPRPM